LVPDEQCTTVTEEECEPVEREVCRPVVRQVCTPGEERCLTMMQEVCRQVESEACATVPSERCAEEEREECAMVPREECVDLRTPLCDGVVEELCQEECQPVWWCKVCRQGLPTSLLPPADVAREAFLDAPLRGGILIRRRRQHYPESIIDAAIASARAIPPEADLKQVSKRPTFVVLHERRQHHQIPK
jgi:hypothetical protein